MKRLFLFILLLSVVPNYAQEQEYDEYEAYQADNLYEEDYSYNEGEEDSAYNDYGDYEDYPAAEAPDSPDASAAPVLPTPAPEAPLPQAVEDGNGQEVFIPLFAADRPLYTVDPANPRLPDNHPFLRLKGTLWRSDEAILSTNERGVVSHQRLYLVFDRNRDAVAFALAPYGSRTLLSYPSASEYISLTPLLETNRYKPSPYARRYVEIPEKYRRPTTNTMMSLIPPNPASEPDPVLRSETYEYTAPEIEELPAEDMPVEEAESAYDNTYGFQSHRLILRAQEVESEWAVVNVGGMDSGIFIQENPSNEATPYTVLFLALEKDGSLSVYTIQNSFDIRIDKPEIAQARELYKRALERRSRMKRFYPVEDPETSIDSALMDFFK